MSTVADIFEKAERYFEMRVSQLLREKRLKAEENGTALNARKAKRDARTAAGREKLDALVRRLSDLALLQEHIIATHCPDAQAVRAALDAVATRVWTHEVPPPPPPPHYLAFPAAAPFFPPIPPPMPPPALPAFPLVTGAVPLSSAVAPLFTSTPLASVPLSANAAPYVRNEVESVPFVDTEGVLYPATESVLKHLGSDFEEDVSPRSIQP